MLFYQFVVSRTSPLAPHPRRISEASVMLRVDIDIERATDHAVAFLEEGGWQISSVRRAQLFETAEEIGADERLRHLHDDAAANGLACAITAFRGRSSAIPAQENVPSPGAVGV